MKRQILATLIAAALSSSASASESSYYTDYFTPTSIQQLMSETKLYNEENGYWEHAHIMNAELVRYLNTMEADQHAEIAAQNEVHGYWQ